MNDFRCKYTVAATDPDLAALRAWSGFPALAAQLAGSGAAAGAQALPGVATAKLRAEAKSPFRLLRLFAAASLGFGAAIASVVTLPRLLAALAALQSGDAAASESLGGVAGNAAVDAAVLVASLAVCRSELQAKLAAEEYAGREETVALLRLLAPSGAPEASLSLAQLRGRRRPVLLVGSRAHLRGCARAAEPLKRELIKRGVLLCVLQEGGREWAAGDGAALEPPARARGFGSAAAASAASTSEAGMGDAFSPNDAGREWRASLWDVPAWLAWAAAARLQQGLQPGEPFFVTLALDGSMTRFEAGAPDWCVLDA